MSIQHSANQRLIDSASMKDKIGQSKHLKGQLDPPVGDSHVLSSVRSSNSHPNLLLIHHHPPHFFRYTSVLNTGLALSEPLQLYKGYKAI